MSSERRRLALNMNRRKIGLSRSDWLAGGGLVISLGAFALSFAHYRMDEAVQDQPFRLAKYQVGMDSYKKFNDRIDDWLRLKSDETMLDSQLIELVGLRDYNNLMAINVARKAESVRLNALAFYKAQMVERTYWPDARPQFDAFDKTIWSILDCSTYISNIAVNLEYRTIPQTNASGIVARLDSKCHIAENVKDMDVKPYHDVIDELGRLIDKKSTPISH